MDLVDIHLTKQFPVICIDGGPCSGKTSAMPDIVAWLQDIGRIPRVTHESATLFMESGFRPGKDGMSVLDFQRQLLYHNIEKENRIISAAMDLPERKNVVILCDRGTMNAQAYMLPGEFRSLITKENLSLVELRDKRYDAVIHMRTAALGAEKYYKNTSIRTGTPEQARERDQRTLDAWIGCPHLYVIDNRTNFKEKVERLKRVIAHIIGYPEPREMEKKFLISPIQPDQIPVPSQTVQIMQLYLASNENPGRIRTRSQECFGSTYFHTKKHGKPGNFIEHERQISAEEFRVLMQRLDPSRQAITKARTCFVWNEQYYELDAFDWPHQGLYMLEAEKHYLRQKIYIPPFIDALEDVSTNPAYLNSNLAKKK